ncbi:MAG: hemolysin family protein [Candidatus Micrarchaeota archaeon]|nr:hemolysin family protein [Candidatus Micrarchaeota archaeon]
MFLELTLLFSLIILSAFFSASESALLSLSRIRVRHILKTNPSSKRANCLSFLKNNIDKVILCILIANNILNISFTVLSTFLAVKYFGEWALAPIATLATIIIILFGEIIPKNLAIFYNEKIALFGAVPLFVLYKLLLPLTIFLEKLVNFLFRKDKRRAYFSEAELRTILDIGVEDKAISAEEKKFFERVLDFNDTLIKEIMVPFSEVKFVRENFTVKEALKFAAKHKKVRYPVLDKENKVVGILNIKDLLDQNPNKEIKDLLKPPFFVSTESIAFDVFKIMQKQKTYLAVVLGPNSTFEGIVTMEDLVEEIVGEIEEAPSSAPTQEYSGELVVNGQTALHDIEKEFGVTIAQADSLGSVSALFHYYFKRPPLRGDRIIINGIKLEVIQTDQMQHLQQIRIRKLS